MKTYNYIILIASIILLFNLFGIQTTSSKFLDIFDPNSPEEVTLQNFFSSTEGIVLGVAVVAAIGIGLYFRSSPESFLLVGYTVTLLALVMDLASIVKQLDNYSEWISLTAGIVFGPLIIGYIHSVISWWGGKQ